jgi:hypothetical protein
VRPVIGSNANPSVGINLETSNQGGKESLLYTRAVSPGVEGQRDLPPVLGFDEDLEKGSVDTEEEARGPNQIIRIDRVDHGTITDKMLSSWRKWR